MSMAESITVRIDISNAVWLIFYELKASQMNAPSFSSHLLYEAPIEKFLLIILI